MAKTINYQSNYLKIVSQLRHLTRIRNIEENARGGLFFSQETRLKNVHWHGQEHSQYFQHANLTVLDAQHYGDIEISDMEIRLPVKFMVVHRGLLQDVSFSKELEENVLFQSKFLNCIFNEKLSSCDFGQCIFSNTNFKGELRDCDFTNAVFIDTSFDESVCGFSCFAGADLKHANFTKPLGNTVILLGSNVSDMEVRPVGGIQTLEDLETLLVHADLNKEEIDKLTQVLQYAQQEVGGVVSIMNTSDYPINDHHVDELNKAIVMLLEYGNKTGKAQTP